MTLERTAPPSALALAGILTIWSPAGARADVVRLAELEQQALAARPELRAREADGRAQAAEFDRARAAFMPQFSLRGDAMLAPGNRVVQLPKSVSPTEIYVSGAPAFQSGSYWTALTPRARFSAELAGTASLYDFGRRDAAGEAARRSGQAARAGTAATREELLATVRVRYLGWLAAHQLAELAGQSATDARARRGQLGRMVAEGTRPQAELAAARSAELSVLLELQRAQADAEGARHALAEAAATELREGDTPDPALLEDGAGAQGRSDVDRAAIQALALQEQAQRAAAVAEARASRPDVRVAASLGVRTQQATRLEDGQSRDGWSTFPLYGASLSVLVPLWDGGSAAAGSAKARAQADAIAAERDRVRLAQLRDAAQADADARHAAERADTARELVELTRARVSDAEAGFQLGAATLDQIAEAKAALRRAETEALLARIDRAAAQLRGTATKP